ncbi:hypothetical protein [Gallintestinimicrobium sp.]
MIDDADLPELPDGLKSMRTVSAVRAREFRMAVRRVFSSKL